MSTLTRPFNLNPADTEFRFKRAYISDDTHLFTATADGLYELKVYLLDYADMCNVEQLVSDSLRLLETPYDEEYGTPYAEVSDGKVDFVFKSKFPPTLSGAESTDNLIGRECQCLGYLYNLDNGATFAHCDFIDVIQH